MALLDLNLAPDEGDKEDLPALNEAIHVDAPIHEDDQVEGDDQGGGNRVLLPVDLNFDASELQEDMQPDGDDAFEQVFNVNGGPNPAVFPFDPNFYVYEDDLQMHSVT
uniref:Uncharacterized protein n=1 Tax=Leersia perrieri TaxID=77586 RepID=A0A0D9Y171_9ORYZ